MTTDNKLADALRFYADPETYFAIGFLADPPCGEFVNDQDEVADASGFVDMRFGKRAREALAEHDAQPAQDGDAAKASRMPDIDLMVTRFLNWKLPEDFSPDAGISFTPMPAEYMPHCWPTGTNLLHAGQARALIEHMLAADGAGELP